MVQISRHDEAAEALFSEKVYFSRTCPPTTKLGPEGQFVFLTIQTYEEGKTLCMCVGCPWGREMGGVD